MKLYRRYIDITPQQEMHLEVDHSLEPFDLTKNKAPMKKQIIEVQKYFADKIARGLYKVENADEHCIIVIVDREFKFKLWIPSLGPSHLLFGEWGEYFMELNLTDEQKESGCKIAKKHRDRLWVDETEKNEREQLASLIEKYPDAIKW